MGLGEGRRKQRLVGSAHTRNAAWSNDASLPGQRLLASMGWAAGQGIGRTAAGRADPIKVAFKLDNRGIGAQRAEREARASGKADAWIGGNGELGNLFERLNAQSAAADKAVGETASTSNVSGSPASPSMSAKEGESDKKAEKRRKREEKKTRKADKAAGKAKRAAEKQGTVIAAEPISAPAPTLNPRMAARARFLRAKRMVGSDAASLNEILGIASPSTSGTSSPMPEAQSPMPEVTLRTAHDGETASAKSIDRERKGKRKIRDGETRRVKDKQDDTDEKKEKRRKSKSASQGDANEKEALSKRARKEEKRRLKDANAKSNSSKNTERKKSKGMQDDIPVVPMSAAATQPALPSSSDPSFDAPGGGRVSHLSVQEYLQNKLILRRAAIVRMRREKEAGVWQRSAAAAVGAN